MRRLPNGIIIAPNRGKPPVPPPGYIADPGNPYVLRPLPVACSHREVKQPTSRCCNQAIWYYCKLFKKRVTPLTCKGCNEATG